MLYELYKVTNLVNGKIYIGQTKMSKGYLKRFRTHVCEALRHKSTTNIFHNAICKYGPENFVVVRLLKNIPEDKIDYYEQLWIKKLNSLAENGHGYNMTTGGQGVHGYTHTKKTRKVMSKYSKLFWDNLRENPEAYEEFCNKRGSKLRGKKFTDTHRHNLSIQAKTRVGEKNPFYGKHHSEETRNKLSDQHNKKVAMCDKNSYEIIQIFKSLTEAQQYLLNNNITSNQNAITRISKICRGIDKSAYGYFWKFI